MKMETGPKKSLEEKLWALPLMQLREVLDLIGEIDALLLRSYIRQGELQKIEGWSRRMEERSLNRERFYALKLQSLVESRENE